MNHDEFTRLVLQRGEELFRGMPWRQDTRPYYVLVSELMLQQTQVDRVIPKFQAFIEAFPDESALANASLADVLRLWQGLGYNRRAKFLHLAAKSVVAQKAFPADEKELVKLPGVGANTAGAIMAYAYNRPAVFVETNVRAVYIHHFFDDTSLVDDAEIRLLLETTLDEGDPRRFYWALMDYGSWLKKNGATPSRSKHYKKQAPLKGSVREVRGQIIASLSSESKDIATLKVLVNADQSFSRALDGLVADGLVSREGTKLELTK
jgi:A/G-specific adenine glycosylase